MFSLDRVPIVNYVMSKYSYLLFFSYSLLFFFLLFIGFRTLTGCQVSFQCLILNYRTTNLSQIYGSTSPLEVDVSIGVPDESFMKI